MLHQRVSWLQNQGEGRRGPGLLVSPGQYRVTLTKVVDGVETKLDQQQTLRVIPLIDR